MEQPLAPAPTWDVPEFAAAAALAGIAVVIAGSTVAAIALGTSQIGSPPGTAQTVGADMQYAAQWANILVAIVLLAVSGLCWWQTESWVEAATASAAGGTGPEARWALDHLRRVYAIASVTEVELVLTGVGALAGFVGAVLFYSGFSSGPGTWARDILPGANLVAVLAA